MENLVKDWLIRSEKCRTLADKSQNEMTQQAYLSEAMALDVCADQLKRAIASQQVDTPDAQSLCKICNRALDASHRKQYCSAGHESIQEI